MLYNWRLLLSTLSFSCLLSHEQLVFAGRIPTRQVAVARRDGGSAAVEMPNLGMFQQYVCPKSTDMAKRQSTTITVPKSELRDLLLQMRLLELQLIDIILDDGTAGNGNSSDIAVPTFLTGIISSTITTTVPLSSLSSAIDSALSSLTSSTVSPSSTSVSLTSSALTPTVRTIRVTRTTTATTITITTTPEFNTTTNVAAPNTTTAPFSNFTISTTVAGFNTTMSLPVHLTTSLTGSITSTDTSSTASGFPELSSTFPEITISQGSSETASPTTLPGGGFIEVPNTRSPTTAFPAPTSPVTDYTFNALSQRNVAVYFGQTTITGTTSLEAQCADPNIDIVIFAFVISQLHGGIYPTVNFGAACGGQTAEMAAQAPGLLSCPELAGNISTCQNTYGKKVLLSVGGATSQISFSGEDQARNFGDVLWNLFGPAGNIDGALRPFGDVEVDGFDIGSCPPFVSVLIK